MRESRVIPQKLAQVRVVPTETQTGPGVLEGYFAVFSSYSRNLGGFVEQIDPGAFTETMRSADVVSSFNHDLTRLLGRTSAGNLTTWADGTGAGYRVVLRENATAREVADFVEAGFIRGSSFMFEVVGEEGEGTTWSKTDQGYPLRTLTNVRLYEVGPTAMPAYPDTERAGQVALRSLAEARGLKFEEVVDAANHGRLGDIIDTVSERSVDAGPTGAPASSRIELFRRRLALAEMPVT